MPPVVVAVDCNEELRCALCLDSWKNPIELVPCGHIFCDMCVKQITLCPLCREPVKDTKTPNRVLLNISLAVPVKCTSCGWRGIREHGATHVCDKSVEFASTPAVHVSKSKYRPVDLSSKTPWNLFGLTQEEYDQIMALFVFFDDDDSGGLNRREVQRLARWLNFARTEREIDCMFNDMDTDKSGTLSLNEFLTWLHHNRPDPTALYGLSQADYNTVMMQFHMFDTDQNGFLDAEEFSRLAMRMGDVGDMNSGRKLFHMIDSDGNGRVDLHEFLTYRARSARR